MTDWKPSKPDGAHPGLVSIPGVTVGEVCGSNDAGQPLVRWDHAQQGTLAEVVWSSTHPVWAECVGVRVILVFEDGQSDRPIVLGLLDAPPEQSDEFGTATKPETLRVESEKELVIECGKAKIALRSDGRIEIRGGHLISRSSGPNKIKGGTVHIN